MIRRASWRPLRSDARAGQTKALSFGLFGLMTVLKNANQWDRSNVVFQDGVLKRYDKKVRASRRCLTRKPR